MEDTEKFELKTHLKNIEMAIQSISETLNYLEDRFRLGE